MDSSSEEEDDNDDDPSYFQRESKAKIPRPTFKKDAYERIGNQMGLVRCDGTEPKIKNCKPYWKFTTDGGKTVYLTSEYKEMRDDKKSSEWRKIDKDHTIDHIALVAASKSLETKYKPKYIDLGFLLAFRSTKHLKFISRFDHKKKKTFRFDSVPPGLKSKALALLEEKIKRNQKRKKMSEERSKIRQKIFNEHRFGKGPNWSYTRYISK